MLTIYYYENSCSYAPHMLLYETGHEFFAKRINLLEGQQNEPDFLSVNPKGRVPALITPEGVLTENPAILLYIAQNFPEKDLAPTEPFKLAKAQSFNMYIASTVHVAHAHKHRGLRWTDEKNALTGMAKKVTENMFNYAKIIENNYLEGPWVLGKKFSICDTYLSLVTRWLESDGVSLENFKKLESHQKYMQSRSSYQKIIEIYG